MYTDAEWKAMRLKFAQRCYDDWQRTGHAQSEANMWSHLFFHFGDFE